MKTQSLCLFSFLIFDIMGFSLILPCFSKIVESLTNNQTNTREFSYFIFSKGLIWSITSFSQFIFSPILGHKSDLYGRKPVLFFNFILQFLANIIWIKYPDSLNVFILVRIIIGMSRSNIGIITAFISDTYEPEMRSKGMAVVGISYSFAFLLGPIFGVYLSNKFNDNSAKSQILACTCLIFNLISLMPLLKLKENKVISKIYSNISLINPVKMIQFTYVTKPEVRNRLRYYALSYFAFIVSFSGLETGLIYIGDDVYKYNSRDQGCMFSLIGIIMIFLQGSILRRQKSFSNKALILISFLCLAIAFICIGFVLNVHTVFVIGQIFFAITSSLYVPSMNSQLSLIGDANSQGLTMGVFRSLNALSRSIGPMVISLLLWTFGIRMTVIFMAAFVIILGIDFKLRNHFTIDVKRKK